MLTRMPHVVKLRLTPAIDHTSGAVVWSLGMLFARVETSDEEIGGEGGADDVAVEHPFEIGIDLSTREARSCYDDETVGTLPEVFEVARWT